MRDKCEGLEGEILQLNYNLKIKLNENRCTIIERKN